MALMPCLNQIKTNLFIIAIALPTLFGDLSFDPSATNIEQLNIINITINSLFTFVKFEVTGKNIFSRVPIKITTNKLEKGAECLFYNEFQVDEVSTFKFIRGEYVLKVPREHYGIFYICAAGNRTESVNVQSINLFNSEKYRWYHQGDKIVIDVPRNDSFFKGDRVRKSTNETTSLVVENLRLEAHYKDVDLLDHGIPEVLAEAEHTIRLFGHGFVPEMVVTFTSEPADFGAPCEYPVAKGFFVEKDTFSSETAKVLITLPPLRLGAPSFYVCIKETNTSAFVHQGTHNYLQIATFVAPLPIWATIIIIVLCLMFSSLFSGLNLGLMAMDRTELKIMCNTGTPNERKYARVIRPVRAHGNFLLCSILLGNVFVNSIFTILLDSLTSGLIAVIFSTVAIVIFGEVTPQAICSRHGLWVGAKTIYITKFVMILTFPIAYPVSKLLDFLLGEEISNVYNRERLRELVKVTTGENDLDKDEVNIISGALELCRKTVADVMTKIEDVFMLDYDAVLDFETVSEIMKSGYSRVPVFEGNRQNIVTMLYIKDLAFVDPDDNTKLKTLCQFYQNACNFVFEDVTLDVMFRIFKEGNKGHMAFVHRVNSEGEGDPFYETIGLITLEDVIEELIQAEIMDETDVFTDNKNKRRRNADRRQDFSAFAEKRGEMNKISISPQLTLATFQFLSTSVEQFIPSIISETILKRLLKQDIIYHIRKSKEWRTDPLSIIYSQGKNSDYFVLILEGRVEVTIGKESLMFEGGPFTYFGTQALVQNLAVGVESPSQPSSTALGSIDSLNLDAMIRHTFQPDYSVRASTEVIYLKIKRQLYLAAKRATLMERAKKDNPQGEYDDEFDKYLHSMDDEDTESTGRNTPMRKRSSKTLNNPPDLNQIANSPKTSSLFSNVSPPHRISPRDANGCIVDAERDEEVSLLSKTS